MMAAQTKSCPRFVLTNKVLLTCSRAHWFTHWLWLRSPYEGRVGWVHQRRDSTWHTKPKIFSRLPLTGKVSRVPTQSVAGRPGLETVVWNSQQPGGWIKTLLGSEKRKGQDQSPETDTVLCAFCAWGSSPGHSHASFILRTFTAVWACVCVCVC